MRKYLPLLLFIGLAFWRCEDEKDTTPPTVATIFPLNNISVSELISITCISSDNEGVEKVELWVNGISTGRVDNTEPYSFDWNTTLIENGNYTITIRAYDTSENTTDSNPIILTVDNTQSNPQPVNISSLVFENGGFTIAWSPSTDVDFRSYSLQKSSDSLMNSAALVFTTDSVEQTTYIDTEIDPMVYQYYQITVMDTFDYETKGEIVPSSLYHIPSPVYMKSVEYTLEEMTISWSESSDDDFLSYELLQSVSDNPYSSLMVITDQSTTSYLLTDFDPTQKNWFKVKVTNSGGFNSTGNRMNNDIYIGECPGNTELNFCGSCEDAFDCDFSGYMNKLSFYSGEVAELYITSRNTINDANLGIFDINGTLVETFTTTIKPQFIKNNKPWENGFGFNKTTEIVIPPLQSGIYFIAESFTNNIYKDKIPFIIKSSNPVDAIIIYPSNTGNAYNKFGGRSLYTNPKAEAVSFLRPQYLRHFSIGFLKWATNSSYNFGYISDSDMEENDILTNTNIIIIPGHSEYWSRNARQNFDTFVDIGKDAIILSGNNMWWQVRYDENRDKLICYKDFSDPIGNPLLKTVHWFEPLLQYPILESLGADYSIGGYGLYNDFGWDGYKITNPESPLFEGCDFAFNDILSMPHVEIDGSPLEGFLEDGTPIINSDSLNFFKFELLGYDQVANHLDQSLSYGTFIVFQKSRTSGVVINTSTTNWCKEGFTGVDNIKVKRITENMINLLLSGSSIFTN